MNNKIKASLIILVFTIITIMDLLLTWIATPDLSMEGNPLVRVFGLGWPAMIGFNIAILALYAAVVWYSFVLYKRPVVAANSFLEYTSKLTSAKGSNIFIAMFGFAISYTMIIGRLLPVIEWIIHIAGYVWVPYQRLKLIIPLGRPDLWVMAVAAVALSIYWYQREHKANKQLEDGLS